MTLYDATQWHEMFVASAGAAAALAGLVFVAVSINVQHILSLRGLPERAMQTIVLLLAALVVSLLGLIPQTAKAMGVELLLLSGFLAVAIGYTGRRAFDTGGNRAFLATRVVAVLPGSVTYLVGGISMIAEFGGGLAWVAVGLITGMIGAVSNAWVLLVEILR